MVKICKLWQKYGDYATNIQIMVKYVNYGKNMSFLTKLP